MAGEVIFEEETTDKLVKVVERDLSQYTKAIHTEWNRHHVQTPLEKAVNALFGEGFEEATEENSDVNTTNTQEAEEGRNMSKEKTRQLQLLTD